MNSPRFNHCLPVTRALATAIICLSVICGCASSPDDSRAKQGAKSGAAWGAGIGLLLGVLADDPARGLAIGAAAGAAEGGYQGWRQDQDDERTRQITQAIHESNASAQQSNTSAADQAREELTRFLGVWQMEGWAQEPGASRVNISAQVNGTIQMTYFLELAYVDFKAEGMNEQIWGTSMLGYDPDAGYSITTRFNTLSESLMAENGTFDGRSRSFTFSGIDYSVIIRFENPNRFTVKTTSRINGRDSEVESYRFTRT